ncbi:MAG: hypothetical protein WBE64_13070, partial [Xanthobacteraceae bacterium]
KRLSLNAGIPAILGRSDGRQKTAKPTSRPRYQESPLGPLGASNAEFGENRGAEFAMAGNSPNVILQSTLPPISGKK